jgi:hypothetical protein
MVSRCDRLSHMISGFAGCRVTAAQLNSRVNELATTIAAASPAGNSELSHKPQNTIVSELQQKVVDLLSELTAAKRNVSSETQQSGSLQRKPQPGVVCLTTCNLHSPRINRAEYGVCRAACVQAQMSECRLTVLSCQLT